MSGSSHSNVTDETIALCCLCIEAHYRSGRRRREPVDPITFSNTNSVVENRSIPSRFRAPTASDERRREPVDPITFASTNSIRRASSRTSRSYHGCEHQQHPMSVDRFFILGRHLLGEHRRRMSGSGRSDVTDETIALCCLCIEAHYRGGRRRREPVDPITFARSRCLSSWLITRGRSAPSVAFAFA